MTKEECVRCNIIFKSITTGRCMVVYYDGASGPLTGNILYSTIAQAENLDPQVFNVSHNGKSIRRDHTMIKVTSGQDVLLNLYIPVLGGKGGFGSMLRAIGAQIEKTTNREACRDLGGRRLRDVHTEKRIKDWINKQGERKKEQEERRKKKLAKLTAEPKVDFNDKDYFEARESLPDQLEDAIEAGLRKAISSPPANDTSTSIEPSTSASTSSSSASSQPMPSTSDTTEKSQTSDKSKSTDASSTTDAESIANPKLSPVKEPEISESNSDPSNKRKRSPVHGAASSSKKRTKSRLWTGIDEDDTSSDEDD